DRVGPHLDAINEVFQRYAARAEHVLTISAVPSMASAWLVPRLGHFVAAHPQIEINLQSSERLVDFDRQLQFDAALRVGGGQWAGLVVERLFD
ncbi:LysR substrate-binding domain-containing protein, partial [Enterobacter hormaechei]|uniref:LysR substrate-binding domain-containing protein n=2 Tax=Gammaproteobacteria TaxID=1236 RepID=UPI00203EE8B8